MIQSSQPRKQRKFIYEAPLHIRRKFLSANLSEKLQGEFGRRSLPLRTGDKVKIMRGEFRGLMGAVKELDAKNLMVNIEKVVRKKVDGTEVPVPVHPSNLQIIEALMEDKRRQEMIKRSGGSVTVTTVSEVKEGAEAEVSAKVEEKVEVATKGKKKAVEEKETVKKTKKFRCPVCKSSFGTKVDMDQHVQKEHKEYR